jgi:hypothetical protein
MELAAHELDKLERYETRAWSRQMRAIRTFIKLTQDARSNQGLYVITETYLGCTFGGTKPNS